MNFLETLDKLNDWKKLPAYRAEPRVDFIVAGALPEIITQKYSSSINLIIPELPLRVGSLYEDAKDKKNKSFKIDFHLKLTNNKNIFIEFKTDSSSRRDAQDKYLERAQEIGMMEVLNGLIQIYRATKYTKKYNYLLNKFIQAGMISDTNQVNLLNGEVNQIEILYIQPSAKADESNVLDFLEVAQIMQQSEDPVYKQFANILIKWSGD